MSDAETKYVVELQTRRTLSLIALRSLRKRAIIFSNERGHLHAADYNCSGPGLDRFSFSSIVLLNKSCPSVKKS